MKEIAIIGPTASGKSALAVTVAKEYRAHILSLDSLAIYKRIDIISAKPTKREMDGIQHFGIDLIEPDRNFSAADFVRLYESTKAACKAEGKNLVIVGGSSFYLKTILDGLSGEPDYSDATRHGVTELLRDLPKAHGKLAAADPETAARIKPGDRYRLEKALLILTQTGQAPSEYWQQHQKNSCENAIRLFEIEMERETLRKRISIRTQAMLDAGAIDECARLERRYGRAPKSMGSIGIKEILDYFDGKLTRQELAEQISTHTAQFAKRQSTFNRHQFDGVTRLPAEKLKDSIDAYLGA